MKKSNFCFFLLLFSINVFSQLAANQKVDSLKKNLANLYKGGTSFRSDTMKVIVLCQLAREYSFINIDSSIVYSAEALKIAEKDQHMKSIARANYQLGYSYILAGKSFRASEYLFKSLEVSEKLKLDTLIGTSNRQIANTYFDLKKYDSAEKFYNKAMPYFLKIKYTKGYANCLNDIGRSYFLRKEYSKALAYFQKCLDYSEKNKIEIMKNYCTWSIANTFIEEKRYDTALHYANIGIRLNETIDGVVEYDWVMGYESFARIYFGKGDYKKALYYAEKPLSQFPQMNNLNKMPIYEILYEIHNKMGNYQKALHYHEGYIQLLEDSKKQEYEKQLQSMQFEYDNLKLKDTNETLKQEKVRDRIIRNGLIAGLAGVLVFVIFFWLNYRLLKNKNLLIEKQKSEILLVKTELEELNTTLERKVKERTAELTKANNELAQKNQEILEALVKGQTIERKRVASELHDNLGSTLSGVKWMLQALKLENLTTKEQKVYSNIMNLMNNAYDEVRLISHHLLPNDFEEKGLFGALYKLTSNINQSEKLKIELTVDKGILINDQKIELELYSVCLELINNIIKHSQASRAEINFMQDKQNLYLLVKDNGKGIDANVADNGKGIVNMKNRVEALSAHIDFKSVNGEGTVVKIAVPLDRK